MLHAVLGALGWQGDHVEIEIDLRPAQVGNFVATASGQDEELHQWAKREADRGGGVPDRFQLGIGQNAVARSLLGGTGYASSWQGLDDVTAQCPTEQRPDRTEGPVSGNGRAIGNDAIEQGMNVAAGNGFDQTIAPMR